MVYGLVGRSGSGKSTAAQVFAEYGFFVIDCDKVAAEVLKSDGVRRALADAFGSDVLTKRGVNRRLLAARAFADREKLDLLNSITHPPIVARLRELCEGREKALLDAPTLFESGADKLCDGIIAVTASDEICEKRLLERGGATLSAIRRRLKLQKSDEYLRSRADFVIENLGDESELRKQIENVAKTL